MIKNIKFIDTIEKFLTDEKIRYTKSVNTISIKKDNSDIILHEDKCDIKESFTYHDRIDLDSHFMRSIPNTEQDVIKFIRNKDSRNLEIRSTMSSFKDKAKIGEYISVITLKDILTPTTEKDETFTINCKCNYPKGLTCKGIRD